MSPKIRASSASEHERSSERARARVERQTAVCRLPCATEYGCPKSTLLENQLNMWIGLESQQKLEQHLQYIQDFLLAVRL